MLMLVKALIKNSSTGNHAQLHNTAKFWGLYMAVPINYNRVGDLAELIQVLEVVETIE